MKPSTFRISTSAALLLGAAFACGPAPVKTDTDSEVIGQSKSGILKLDTIPNGVLAQQHAITATFIDAPSDSLCTVKESGPCRFIDCPAARASLRGKDAGNLTVTNTASKATTPLFFSVSKYEGSGSVTNDPLFAAGDGMSVKAAGATVPAFDLSVQAPSPVQVASPTDTMLTIKRSQDFTVSWTGQSSGKFVFQIVGVSPANPNLECRFDSKALTGTIPSAALQLLPAGTYNADAFTRNRLVEEAGNWSVSLDARFFAAAGNDRYKRSASLQ